MKEIEKTEELHMQMIDFARELRERFEESPSENYGEEEFQNFERAVECLEVAESYVGDAVAYMSRVGNK